MLWGCPPKTAPNDGIGINDRALVCTMLGLRLLVGGVDLGDRRVDELDTRGSCGEVYGRLQVWVKDCSSFLQGNGELGVEAENALLRVGLSARWNEVGKARWAVLSGMFGENEKEEGYGLRWQIADKVCRGSMLFDVVRIACVKQAEEEHGTGRTLPYPRRTCSPRQTRGQDWDTKKDHGTHLIAGSWEGSGRGLVEGARIPDSQLSARESDWAGDAP